MLAWVIMTPLGAEVVPDVYMISARSSGRSSGRDASRQGCSAFRSA